VRTHHLALSRFEVPRVGDADTLSYFLEAKYKLTESLFLAARWNQQFFDDVGDGRGGSTSWDRDLYRADFAMGYRFNRNLQTKLQYSYGYEGGENANADHLLAAQVTVRF
jgi:predicted porin